MKRVIIKEFEDIEKIEDDNFKFRFKKSYDYILIISKHTNIDIDNVWIGELEYLKNFGYDIRMFKKATLEIMEEVANMNCANLQRFANTGRWMIYVEDKCFAKKEWKHIEPYLEKEGYYL